MTRKNNTGTVVIIAIVLILLLWFVLPQLSAPKPSALPSNVEYGDVNAQGQCVGRTGLSFVMCCGVWDDATSSIKWVPCEDTIVDTPTQAIVTLGGGARSYDLVSIMLSAKVNNTGNLDINARLSAASSSIVSGGSATADTKFDNAWLPMIGNITLVPQGQVRYISMTSCNPILLDTPAASTSCGNTLPAYTMTDGVYRQSITVVGTGVSSTVTSTQSTTVDVEVKQENIGFSIEVTQTS